MAEIRGFEKPKYIIARGDTIGQLEAAVSIGMEDGYRLADGALQSLIQTRAHPPHERRIYCREMVLGETV